MHKALLPVLLLSSVLTGAATAHAAQVYYAQPYQRSLFSNQPDQYQGPHGHYASQTDFIRSLNGTPCGIECAQEHARLHPNQDLLSR